MSNLKANSAFFFPMSAFNLCIVLNATITLSRICLPRTNALYLQEIRCDSQIFSLLAIAIEMIL